VGEDRNPGLAKMRQCSMNQVFRKK